MEELDIQRVEEIRREHAEWRELASDPTLSDEIIALADEVLGIRAEQAAHERDVEHIVYTPEAVTDAAFESQANWWQPGRSPAVTPVDVGDLINSLADAVYKATMAFLERAGDVEYGQALPYGGDDGNTVEVRKSFGADKDRPLDEGYALARRVCGPWEVIGEVQRYD